eukprot:COSAG06_NODE_50334_length_319_cov_0.981818_1_plen_24_part_01
MLIILVRLPSRLSIGDGIRIMAGC